MIFSVYFYKRNCHYSASVHCAGFYFTFNDAKKRLQKIIPDYKITGHNSHIAENNNVIGWINKNTIGDINNFDLTCNQPYSAISLI